MWHWHCLTLTLSDIEIYWVVKFLSCEIFCFHLFLRFHLVWDFFFFFFQISFFFFFRNLIFFGISLFVILFTSWHYLTLTLTRFWLYLTLTLTRSWYCLTLALSDTEIDWVLKSVNSEKCLFSLFFFFWDFIFFEI